MITEQERLEEVAATIAYNLIETVVYREIVFYDNLINEIDAYTYQEDGISYNELEARTIEAIKFEGYEVLDYQEFTTRIAEEIAEEIYRTTENYRTSITNIERILDYIEYPNELDYDEILDQTINKLLDLGHTITDYDELITPFPYHCTPNAIIAPYSEDKNKNIKGLELEISDDDYNIEQELAELANEYIIGTPDNWNNTFQETPNIALEEDGSVKYELIFRAQTNDKLIEEVEKLKYLTEIVDNHTGTSAHIHMNRQYIEKELGLTEIDIVKAAEFLSYQLFLISGRRKETAHEWARSQLPCPLDANLAVKAKHVDRINKISYAKYNFVNCTPEDTIELRIFSNKCNFNKYVINMYLETVDFIIELADYMKNKNYTKELKNIIPLCKNHFEKIGYTLDFYNTKETIMNEFKEPKELLKTAIKNEWIAIDDHIARFINIAKIDLRSYDTIRRFINMVKVLNEEHDCDYDFNINPETIDILKLTEEIKIDIDKRYLAKLEVI